MTNRAVTIVLPYPPSANRLYRHFRGRTVIATEGVQYYERIKLLAIQEALVGRFNADERLSIRALMYQPDRRRRDIDNATKAVWDALRKAGVFEDDSQIDHEEQTRIGVDAANPRVVVTIDLWRTHGQATEEARGEAHQAAAQGNDRRQARTRRGPAARRSAQER